QLSNGEVLAENINNPIEHYYFTFGHVKEKDAIMQDADLVFYVDYSKIKSLGVANGKVYNPVTIGLNALRAYQTFLKSGDEYQKEVFLANANWLVENIDHEGAWILNQDVAIGKHLIKGPWVSALSQGLGISVLTRSYQLTGDQKMLETANLALEPFTKTIAKGGVATENEFGLWFEEYPLLGSPTHVFNGFMYSLFGLNDLAIVGDSKLAEQLFETGILALEKALPLYDAGSWTKYSLNQESNLKNHWNYCSPWYQKLHTSQLTALAELTQNSTLKSYSQKFAHQRDKSWVNMIIYPAYIAYTDLVFVIRNLS
ncbi:MAG: D-glucuronyl C5-epimerase family protein, partial [Flavobacteriales bacterium]